MSYISKILAVLRRIKDSLLNMLRNGKKTISKKSMKEMLEESKGEDPKVNEFIEEIFDEIVPEEKTVEGESKGVSKVLTGIAGKETSQIAPIITDTTENR